MAFNILLLDCSYILLEKLKRQGFSTDAGTIGFSSGVRFLPSQIYESEVIIYNPISRARKRDGSALPGTEINDLTPEYNLSHLKDHVLKGATVLVFANHFGEEMDANAAYEWIPFMPKLVPTKDQHVWFRRHYDNWHDAHLKPAFLDINELSLPVRLKLKHRQALDNGSDEISESSSKIIEIVPLLYNKNDEVLGVSFRFGQGYFYVLPTFESNDEVVCAFLHKIIPDIYGTETQQGLIDNFTSPQEEMIRAKIKKMDTIRQETERRLEKAREELVQAELTKAKTVRGDETAVLILNYYELAQQQDDVALFYLYKIIEALEKRYGSESEAKKQLGNNTGWNLIGKLANVSYADIRHAPKPGEKIKQWNNDEIKTCFDAAGEIANAYFATLFPTEIANQESKEESEQDT